MRTANRKDANHASIVAELETRGFIVFDVSRLAGLGFDLVVYSDALDRWLPVEIKIPEPAKRPYHFKDKAVQSKDDRRLTPSEKRAKAKAPIPTVETAQEVVALFGM